MRLPALAALALLLAALLLAACSSTPPAIPRAPGVATQAPRPPAATASAELPVVDLPGPDAPPGLALTLAAVQAAVMQATADTRATADGRAYALTATADVMRARIEADAATGTAIALAAEIRATAEARPVEARATLGASLATREAVVLQVRAAETRTATQLGAEQIRTQWTAIALAAFQCGGVLVLVTAGLALALGSGWLLLSRGAAWHVVRVPGGAVLVAPGAVSHAEIPRLDRLDLHPGDVPAEDDDAQAAAEPAEAQPMIARRNGVVTGVYQQRTEEERQSAERVRHLVLSLLLHSARLYPDEPCRLASWPQLVRAGEDWNSETWQTARRALAPWIAESVPGRGTLLREEWSQIELHEAIEARPGMLAIPPPQPQGAG